MKNKYILYLLLLLLAPFAAFTQEEEKKEEEGKPELSLQVRFHTIDNKLPYLLFTSKIRKDNALQVVERAKVKVYFMEETEESLIGEVTTDDKGLGKLVLPPSIKPVWDSNTLYTFYAVASETKDYAETRVEKEVTRARLELDTTQTEEGKRAVAVKVLQYDGTDWVPAADVEVKVTVKRSAAYLPVGEEETYTTDSTGMVLAEFTKDSLPTADKKGNIILAARIEDNDLFGDLILEKAVPWGVYRKVPEGLTKRSLWATADKAPYWLLFMAISIIATVWGVIFYLVYVFIRIRKEGRPSKIEVEPRRPVAVTVN
jgi:hypothetical protein